MASNTAQKPIAGEPGDAHIPVALNAPALMISSASASVELMPTIFVGIVDDNYREDHWNNHCNRIKDLFGIAAGSVGELKVKNRGNHTVDAEQLARDMRQAVEIINRRPFDKIRVVHLGIGNSPAVDQALKALIRGWKLPRENKYIQLVVLGDTIDHHYLNFCKSLCLNELCNTVQYYNTMDYDQYGFVDESKGALFHELSRRLTSRFLDESNELSRRLSGGLLDESIGSLLQDLSTRMMSGLFDESNGSLLHNLFTRLMSGNITQGDPTGTQPDN